jgi:hypothetical protein
VSARERVGATSTALRAGAICGALFWGGAAALLVLTFAGVADWIGDLPRNVRSLALPVGLVAGMIATAAALWRWRRVGSREAVALWIEERVPALHYALVTALEPRSPESQAALEQQVARASWRRPIARALARAVVPPVALVLALLALAAVLPAGIVARITTPEVGDALDHPPALGATPAARVGSRLAPLVAIVTPPVYSGLRARTIEDPARIMGLAASSVRIEGRGEPVGLEARLAGTPLEVTGGGVKGAALHGERRWRVIFAMPPRPTALRLREGSRGSEGGGTERIIVLDPRVDSAPRVTLAAPTRDTVVRAAVGTLPLVAHASDDFGLTAMWLEYIVSSGEGETFAFRSGVVHRRALSDARAASLDVPLHLDSLKLGPGDIVHVRAVAVDGNTATGPDTGVSETRAIRVARAREYDSVAVGAAPPPDVGQSALSERMLIDLAVALERRRPALAREVLVAESHRISADQARLRRRVGDIIFARLGGESGVEESADTARGTALSPEALLEAADRATGATAHALDFEGDETPVVAINRPLLEAYNAMWEANRALDVGEPGAAISHMRAALDAIERARSAERFYLRGKPAAVVVDLAKVRLAGSIADADARPRAPRPVAGRTGARHAARFDAALALLRANPAAAMDSLVMLRVDALDGAPTLAAALGPAIDALRAGRDATPALVRARRAVQAPPDVRARVGAWGDAW